MQTTDVHEKVAALAAVIHLSRPFLARRIPRLPCDSSVFICGTRAALQEKLEVKMTKALGKLQGFVFTILGTSMAFTLLAFSSEKAKIPQPASSTE